MTRKTMALVLVFVWAALFLASIAALALSDAVELGPGRGFGRLAGFMTWQSGAAIAAIAAVLTGWPVPDAGRRWFSRVPAMGHLALAAVLLAAVGYRMITRQVE